MTDTIQHICVHSDLMRMDAYQLEQEAQQLRIAADQNDALAGT